MARRLLRVVLFLLVCAGTQAQENARPYKRFPATWQATLDEVVMSGEAPGVMVLIESPEWGIRIGTAGLANIQDKVAITPDLRWRIGSVSKVFNGAAMHALEQKGMVRLDDHITQWLPANLVPNAESITVLHCLRHQTGLNRFLCNIEFHLGANGKPPMFHPMLKIEPQELLQWCVTDDREALYSPGKGMNDPWFEQKNYVNPLLRRDDQWVDFYYYSNAGTMMTGLIMEEITGKSYARVIKEEVLDPLDMTESLVCDRETLNNAEKLIHGYSEPEGLRSVFKIEPDDLFPRTRMGDKEWSDVTHWGQEMAYGAGAVTSNLWDMRRFIHSLMQGDEIINETTRRKLLLMLSMAPYSDIQSYGIGIYEIYTPGGVGIGHSGTTGGFTTSWFYFPQLDTYYIAAFNSQTRMRNAVLYQLIAQVHQAAGSPTPRNGAQGVAFTKPDTVRLAWIKSVTYGNAANVYFGTDPEEVEAAMPANVDTRPVRFIPIREMQQIDVEVDKLKPGTTYYWRVDILKSIKTVTGPVWSFTTAE